MPATLDGSLRDTGLAMAVAGVGLGAIGIVALSERTTLVIAFAGAFSWFALVLFIGFRHRLGVPPTRASDGAEVSERGAAWYGTAAALAGVVVACVFGYLVDRITGGESLDLGVPWIGIYSGGSAAIGVWLYRHGGR